MWIHADADARRTHGGIAQVAKDTEAAAAATAATATAADDRNERAVKALRSRHFVQQMHAVLIATRTVRPEVRGIVSRCAGARAWSAPRALTHLGAYAATATARSQSSRTNDFRIGQGSAAVIVRAFCLFSANPSNIRVYIVGITLE